MDDITRDAINRVYDQDHQHLMSDVAPVDAAPATLSTNLAGINNDLDYTAVTPGALGNEITIEYEDPGVEAAAEVVTVTGRTIHIMLRSVGGTLSTGDQLKTALAASWQATALVTVADKAANDGSGVVIAMVATALAGGIDGTVGQQGEPRVDATNLYICIAPNTVADSNWRKIAHAPL